MIIEHEEIDLHPYGRGGIYEGIFYRDRPRENTNIVVVLIWLILVSSIVVMAGAIVTVSVIRKIFRVNWTVKLDDSVNTSSHDMIWSKQPGG
ncbi:hypothetical protein MN116_006797 [Schistosoma mekongi]|uniref:Uncharacterized protein n=1 Tax=Schistosoma mekongi TaxID=38744 RepID=A0AAE2D2N2_SCHME|nr:hypothetical protein MN116_006797 [Schistosoma mekongi]